MAFGLSLLENFGACSQEMWQDAQLFHGECHIGMDQQFKAQLTADSVHCLYMFVPSNGDVEF
jgi:hypothetical protein